MSKQIRPRSGTLHYAWIIVAAEFLLTGMCVGTLVNSMGVFVKPVSDGLKIDRSSFTLVLSISSLVSTACYPLWGSYMKTGSIRRSYLVSALVVPLILTGYSVSTRLWQFYLLSAVLGVVTASVTSLATSSLLNRWFHEKRGIAVSIATCGSGLLPSLLIPVITQLIARHGWKFAYRWLGLVYGVVVLACALFFLKDAPAQMGLSPYGAAHENGQPVPAGGVPRSRAVHSRAFFFLLLAAFFCGLIYSGINHNVLAYLSDLGYTERTASLVLSASMLLMIGMKLIMGVLFDRFGFTSCFVLAAFGALVSSLSLLLASHAAFVCLFVAAFGVFSGFPALCCSYGTLQLFGPRDFSSICSLVTSGLYLGLACGSTTVSFLFDTSGSYVLSWLLTAALSVAAFVLLSAAVRAARSIPSAE